MDHKGGYAPTPPAKAETPANPLRRDLGFYTHEEVCGILGVAPGTGYNRRAAGDWPPSIRIGRGSLYPVLGVKRWLAGRKTR
jgi:predicted DNA-binding transcriptional regulator AlpA